jgi:hypothetical protein
MPSLVNSQTVRSRSPSHTAIIIPTPLLVFFTHCHPARAIIHKPNFSADLSQNRVPSYLLHAVCALAAPLSKQPRIRTTPRRFAGKPFAQEALKLMFDSGGRLVCEPNLATAQALCLLQIHDYLAKEQNLSWNSRYHGKSSSPFPLDHSSSANRAYP